MIVPWVGLAIAIALPFMADGYWLYLLTLAGAYGVVSVGLNFLTGLSGQISLGHAGFFAIGAYVSTIAQLKYNVPFALALVLSIASGWLIGLGVGFPAVRLRGLYLAIATMAFGISVERALYHFKGITGGPYGLTVNPPQIFDFVFNTPSRMYYLVLAIVTVTIWFVANLVKRRPGRMLVALRDSELAASSLGVNVPRLKVTAFAVSAALASLGGALYAPIINFISVEHFTLWLSITFVSMIVVGGLGSIIGSFLGAIFVVVLPELLRGFGGHHQLVYGLAMILVFVFWPTGLIGLLQKSFDWIASRIARKRPPPPISEAPHT
ncbi:branched-chain amino acid ABC transporter permease [Simplicispira suum]|uniref:branched-chain amino acid ABC transporter permease n=1 Tax=Simplicispira suum TaxID=2109915 RepID=UPI001FE8094D|nr:branched-chain amino acid ABC transporter permease [Simplicispira suum]